MLQIIWLFNAKKFNFKKYFLCFSHLFIQYLIQFILTTLMNFYLIIYLYVQMTYLYNLLVWFPSCRELHYYHYFLINFLMVLKIIMLHFFQMHRGFYKWKSKCKYKYKWAIWNKLHLKKRILKKSIIPKYLKRL